MCGRFLLITPIAELARAFAADASTDEGPPPRWNIAPSQLVLAVTSPGGGTRRLETFKWGLVPGWAKDPSVGNRMINARSEKVASSGAFRSAFRTRRCLIPADGFYEWAKTDADGVKLDVRQPYHLHAGDGRVLALGGLWETWHDAEGGELRTCTIITTRPNATVATLHDRMPVIVSPSDWDRWLDPAALDADESDALFAPAPDDLLVVEPISTAVNNPRHEGAQLLAP